MKPLRGMAAVYLREMLILRRRILKQFASWLVSPLLYLVAFHYAMNDTLVGSRPYAEFPPARARSHEQHDPKLGHRQRHQHQPFLLAYL